MTIRYLYRIDDIHPRMIWKRFDALIALFDRYRIIPLLGVIPDNKDETLNVDPPNPQYGDILKALIKSGKVEICQHGVEHVYSETQHSVNQILYGRASASEVATKPYAVQREMLQKGKLMMEEQGLHTLVWMAPSHTSDWNTYRALRDLGFKQVTDGTAVYPYRKFGLTFIPQQIWHPKKEFFVGIFTICLHTQDTDDELLRQLERHLASGAVFTSFGQVAALPVKWYGLVLNTMYRLKRIIFHHCIRHIRNLKRGANDKIPA